MRVDYARNGYWLAKKRDFSPHTVSDYRVTFRRFVEYIGGEQPIEDVSSEDVHGFLNCLTEDLDLAPKTRSNAWTALSSLWTWAENELEIPHIIRGNVKRPSYRRRPPRPFTEQEIRLLLSGCDHMTPWISPYGQRVQADRPTAVRDRAIMLVLLDTGIRISELTELTVADYEQRNGQLLIRHGKGDKQRVVYLGRVGQQALWRYLATRDVQGKAPLVATRTGTWMERVAVGRLIKRAGNRVGVQDATPHRFRHTYAITFLRNGGNPLKLQWLLGHEKMDTVLIYVELARVDLERAQLSASPVDNWRL